MESAGLPDTFHKALAQLQALHDRQVTHLTAEVVRLRRELDSAKVKPLPNTSELTVQQTLELQDASNPPMRGRKSNMEWAHTFVSASREAIQVHAPQRQDRLARAYLKYNECSEKLGHLRHDTGWRGICGRVVGKTYFDIIFGAMIMLNTACIGIETSFNRAGRPVPILLKTLEYIFIILYIAELGIRFGAHGIIRALQNHWVKFDFILVLVGTFGVVVKIANVHGLATMEKILLVRIFRLARLAKVFRLIQNFHTVWMLVQGLLNALPTLVWTGCMIFTLLYVFSVLGLEMLQLEPALDSDYNRIVTTHFSDLPSAMLALVQGLTLDSFSSIYRPLMIAKPYMVLYFVPFILIIPVALMNLVTAIMVNIALEQATEDKKAADALKVQRKKARANLLKEMFRELDTDNSGIVELSEMLFAPEKVQSLIFELAERPYIPGPGSQRELQAIFEAIDTDCSGGVEVNEFCEGLMRLPDAGAMASRMITQVRTMKELLRNLPQVSSNHIQMTGALKHTWEKCNQPPLLLEPDIPREVESHSV